MDDVVGTHQYIHVVITSEGRVDAAIDDAQLGLHLVVVEYRTAQ